MKVEGRPATLGANVDPELSQVEVDGQVVILTLQKYYLAFNKPLGYLVTKSDPQRRRTVMNLLNSLPYAALLNPVGRLDKDTEGLLLLTNDGELAHRLTHPSYEIKKIYEVTTNKKPTSRQLQTLRHGFVLDGRMTFPAEVIIVEADSQERRKCSLPVKGKQAVRVDSAKNKQEPKPSFGGKRWTVRLTIHEGRNRQIRRMFEHVHLPVINLRRIAIGPISLGNLKSGAHRHLTESEVQELKRGVNLL